MKGVRIDIRDKKGRLPINFASEVRILDLRTELISMLVILKILSFREGVEDLSFYC